jgi:hypothetical protein
VSEWEFDVEKGFTWEAEDRKGTYCTLTDCDSAFADGDTDLYLATMQAGSYLGAGEATLSRAFAVWESSALRFGLLYNPRSGWHSDTRFVDAFPYYRETNATYVSKRGNLCLRRRCPAGSWVATEEVIEKWPEETFVSDAGYGAHQCVRDDFVAPCDKWYNVRDRSFAFHEWKYRSRDRQSEMTCHRSFYSYVGMIGLCMASFLVLVRAALPFNTFVVVTTAMLWSGLANDNNDTIDYYSKTYIPGIIIE